MDTVYVKIGKTTGLQVNGDIMSGNTFPVKDYIRQSLKGRWDGNRKVWIIDTDKFDYYLDRIGSSLHTDNNPPDPKPQDRRQAHPGWCNKCHSYCYGDCEASQRGY